MLKALVVDDDVNVSLFISRLLEKKFNCKVESAESGAAALKRLSSFAPEIIFLDITMPGMDGIETLEAIKATKDFKDVPIVMITAISGKETVMKAMKMGAVAYILKPLVFLPVYEKLKEVFSRFKIAKGTHDNISHSNKEFKLKKILVIDDDENFLDRFKAYFNDDFLILGASNGIDGLSIFADHLPDFVVISEMINDINIDVLVGRIKKKLSYVKVFTVSEKEKLSRYEEEIYKTIINNN